MVFMVQVHVHILKSSFYMVIIYPGVVIRIRVHFHDPDLIVGASGHLGALWFGTRRVFHSQNI